jgi:hypothetical protein
MAMWRTWIGRGVSAPGRSAAARLAGALEISVIVLALAVAAAHPCRAGSGQTKEPSFTFIGTASNPGTEPDAAIPRVQVNAIDPWFRILVKVTRIVAGEVPWKVGSQVVFLIHSPSLTFQGDPPNGGRYRFTLTRGMDGGRCCTYRLSAVVFEKP